MPLFNPIPTDGWIDCASDSWSFSSVDGPYGVITVPTDFTTRADVGWRVKFTQTTVKTGIIHTITATTIGVYFGTGTALTNAAISAMAISPSKAPIGFNPSTHVWSETLRSSTGNFTASPVLNTWSNPGTMSITLPIGRWNILFECGIRCQTTAAQTAGTAFVALSTSNAASADTTGNTINVDSQGVIVVGGASGQLEGRLPGRRSMVGVVMAAKTQFFLVTKSSTAAASMASIGFDGVNTETYVVATSSYL